MTTTIVSSPPRAQSKLYIQFHAPLHSSDRKTSWLNTCTSFELAIHSNEPLAFEGLFVAVPQERRAGSQEKGRKTVQGRERLIGRVSQSPRNSNTHSLEKEVEKWHTKRNGSLRVDRERERETKEKEKERKTFLGESARNWTNCWSQWVESGRDYSNAIGSFWYITIRNGDSTTMGSLIKTKLRYVSIQEALAWPPKAHLVGINW